MSESEASKRARRVQMFAAKLAADTISSEPPRWADPTDEALAAAFAECVRPPSPQLYEEIRAAFARLAGQHPVGPDAVYRVRGGSQDGPVRGGAVMGEQYARTGSGKPVLCDGCGAPVLAGYDVAGQVWPIPADLAISVYGRADLVYIVCPPPAAGGGFNPCVDLARLADEWYEAIRCRVPDCRGERCEPEGRS